MKKVKIKEILKGILFVILALLFVVGATYFGNWVNKKTVSKIEPTGEKEYACTNDWREDKVIRDCKWYSVYKKVD